MRRYLDGLKSGLEANGIAYEVVRPVKKYNAWVKYVTYSRMAYKRRKESGMHVVVSERYGYLAFALRGANSKVICHDLHTLYKEAKTPAIHQRLYRFFVNAMRHSSQIVCVSEHTRQDLHRFFPKMPKDKCKVVFNGIEPYWASPKKVEAKDNNLVEYFSKWKVVLSVGTDVWYKDIERTLHVLSELDESYRLLRIGGFSGKSRELIIELNLSEKVLILENIDDTTLKFCYQNAHCLLFPSISEGFGWPGLEASLAGCPVVTSGAGAIKEVLGDVALIAKSQAEMVKLINEIEGKLSRKENYLSWKDQVKLLTAS